MTHIDKGLYVRYSLTLKHHVLYIFIYTMFILKADAVLPLLFYNITYYKTAFRFI